MKYITVLLLSVFLIPLTQSAYSQSIIDQIGGALGNATSGVGQALSNATSGAGQAASNATSGVGQQQAINIAESAGQAASNATSGVSSAGNNTAERRRPGSKQCNIWCLQCYE